MRTGPPNAFAVQLVRLHEGNDVRMPDSRNSVNQLIRAQQLASPAGISDQQLAIHQFVPGGFVSHDANQEQTFAIQLRILAQAREAQDLPGILSFR
jgi:hypothetical protein